VLTVDGELDISTAPRCGAQVIDLIGAGRHRLVVDMNAVTFIDSTGLGVLIGALKRLRGVDGELRLVATVDPVMRTIRVTGLHRVFELFTSVGAAATLTVGAP
jgi:anti-sigma B factor antagonist